MLRFLTCIFFAFLMICSIYGMPAWPHLVRLEEGSKVYLKGDEYYKWGITEDGYTVLPSGDGWVYAQTSSNGFAKPSRFKLQKTLDAETKSFLNTQSKGIPIEPILNNKTLPTRSRSSEKDNHSIVGERKALVILMSFADLNFVKNNKDFYRLFNEVGYSEDDAIGSVTDYFLWSSGNQLKFTCDVIGPYVSSHDMKYYGKNIGLEGRDQNTFKLFEEALTYAQEVVNLSDYDSDEDGYIDNIHIIFAGHGEEAGARSDAIWSHEMTFPDIKVGDLKIDRYSCAPELRGNSGNNISRIGPHCHEMGHALGAMDFYDVDYQNNGQFSGTGQWDIMATGSWNNDGISPPDFNPYVKIYNFGWTSPQLLDEGYNEIFPLSEDNNQIFLLHTPIENDFYLIENRKRIGFDSGIPGDGLLIFHIGPDIENRGKKNSINSYFPQQCYVVCASSQYPNPYNEAVSYGNIDSSGCPYPGSTNNRLFSDASIPSSACIDGSESGIVLSDISYIDGTSIIVLHNGTLPTPQYIWTEDFESLDCIDNWSQNKEEWKLASLAQHPDNIPNNKNDFPILHDSNYLYSTLPTSLNNKDNFRIIQTQNIEYDEKSEYSLHFQYFNSPKISSNRAYNNVLNIYFNTLAGESLLLKSLESSDYNWIEEEIYIPKLSNSGKVSFVFEHRGSSSGYVCIDDIQLIKKEGNIVSNLHNNELEDISIKILDHNIIINSTNGIEIMVFDAFGRFITKHTISEGEFSFTLSKGIYFFTSDKIKPCKIMVH